MITYQNTWFLDDVQHHCKTLERRRMDRDARTHDYVEMVGGPLDGRKFKETANSMEYEHNTAQVYEVDGYLYRPHKVVKVNGKNVLMLKCEGPSKYKGMKRKK